MITILPKLGALRQVVGALICFEDDEVWSSDYYTVSAADGGVRFKIKNKFLFGADIVLDGVRYPLIRYRGFLGSRQVFHIRDEKLDIRVERTATRVRYSLGRWSAENDERSYTMSVDLKKEEIDLPFVLAAAHQLWVAQIGS